MMEKLGAPQTHLNLKAMIKEVDEDEDNKISFREVSFQRVFQKLKTIGVIKRKFGIVITSYQLVFGGCGGRG